MYTYMQSICIPMGDRKTTEMNFSVYFFYAFMHFNRGVIYLI